MSYASSQPENSASTQNKNPAQPSVCLSRKAPLRISFCLTVCPILPITGELAPVDSAKMTNTDVTSRNRVIQAVTCGITTFHRHGELPCVTR